MTQRGFAFLPILLIIGGVVLVGILGFVIWQLPSMTNTGNTNTVNVVVNANTVACTEEAKLCPDGSAVGRTGPNCEFAACPGENTNTSVDLTADWETYTNDTYGYSIRYPKGWVYDAMFLESVVFNSESTGQWRLSIDMEPTARSVQENIDTPIHNSLGEATHLQGDEWERSARTIDGQQAIRIVVRELHPGDYGDTKTLVVNDGFLYTLSQGTGSDPIESAMVDSLRFTSRKTIADWKTYTNDEFGFSFKYPADYQLETGSGDVQLIARSFHPQGLLAFGVWRGEQEDCECELITYNGKTITVGDSQYNDSWETDYMWSTFQFTDVTTTQATDDDSVSLSPEDQQALESVAFAVVDQKTSGQWDKRIDVGRVDASQNAVVGYWWARDRWQWIAWRQAGGDWNILVSLDGFDCTELESLPTQYESFFHNVIYISSGEKYCFSHTSR
ncbi:MAG: hypothetical protein WCV86_02395 [Patescibacteria group bacterium]|jgi:hypothetical protein